jgi:hypothetical protein
MDNLVDGLLHSRRCQFLASRDLRDCDCRPLVVSEAMTGDDVGRIFAPLPPEEAEALREYLD